MCMHVNIVEPLACVTAFLMDEALLSISPAGCGQFMKMLLTFESCVIFGTNFTYLYMSTLTIHWYAKQ